FLPRNVFLFLHGQANVRDLTNLSFTTKPSDTQVEVISKAMNLNFLDDVILAKKTKGNYECGCLKFERPATFKGLSKEYAVLTIIGEIMFSDFYQVDVDPQDVSITYFKKPLRMYKHDILTSLTEENVEKAKEKFLNRMDEVFGASPIKFTREAGLLYYN